MATTTLRLVEGGTRLVLAPDNALAAQSAAQAVAAALDAAGSAESAQGYAEDAAAERAIIGDAASIAAARDAALLYKEGAEAAALPLPALADDVAVDRLAVAADRVATEAARDAAQQVVFNIVPIAQSALITTGGGIVIGTGAVQGTSAEASVSVGYQAGIDNNSRKLTAVGPWAGQSYTGYAPALLGTFTARDANCNHLAAVGTHAAQKLNKIGRVVHGYGAFASGTVTFTGLPIAGDTITFNGVAFTASAAPATGYEFLIGATAAATVTKLFAKLAAATDEVLKDAMYRIGTGANTNRIELLASGRGAWGNAFTLGTSSGSVAVSGATLSGGTDYINSASSAGGAVMGFTAYLSGDFGTTRPAHGWLTFASNPADGDQLALGTSGATFTFKASASAGTDIQIGATATDTAVNTLTNLRGQAGGQYTVAEYYFWRHPDGPRIYVVYKTNGGDTFRVQSRTAAVTGSGYLFGAQTTVEPSTVLGSQTGAYSTGDANTLMMGGGDSLQGSGNFVAGKSAGTTLITSNSFIAAPNGAQRLRGDHILAIGAGITNGVQQGFKQISGVTAAGIITFAARHGFPVGERINATQRNTTTPSNLIKSDGVNLPTSGSALKLVAIDPRRVQFYDLPTEDNPQPVFSVSGTATEIEIARVNSDMTTAIALGRNAALESLSISIGSTHYTGGTKIRGGHLQVLDGGLQINPTLYIPSSPGTSAGPAAQGYVALTGQPADGDTFTLNGIVFTFKTTPTVSSTDVLIGATTRDTTYNLIAAFNANDPNTTSLRAHRAARASFLRFSGTQFRVTLICEAYSGNTYTLAASGTNLAVSGATLTGSSMGTTPLPTAVPDGTIVRIQHHPKQGGRPGLAMADHANSRWQFL